LDFLLVRVTELWGRTLQQFLAMKESINKSDWLIAQECLSKAWFGLRTVPATPGESELFRMEQGQEIGRLARELYPQGVLISQRHGKTPAEITRDMTVDTSFEILFEPTFAAGPFVAKADILKREGGGWHVLEVKSSFSDTGEIQFLIADLAYTVMVLKRVGLPVVRSSLILLSRKYRFGGSVNSLFEIIDKTAEVNNWVAKFEGVAHHVIQALFGNIRPRGELISACRSCTFFDSKCLGFGLAHTVLELPGLHHAKLKELSAKGIIDEAQVPDDFDLNDRQQRAKLGARIGKLVVDPALGASLEIVAWPCYYLDFETVATVLPIYEGHGCHRQVLTQFGIHHRESIDAEPRHSEFLADAKKDCERELAEALITEVGDHGSIIVYSTFEETRIKALRDTYGDLAKQLQLIIDRLVNLLPIIQDNVYHPEFRGSFSIKNVLSALVPDLSYAGLEVADGDTAITRFARMARGEIVGDEVSITRKRLLEYCKLDTLAMVKLHETLDQLGGE
jgi:predicted RecB family nuclease